MRRSRKFVSMPIVSLGEGIQIGSVRNLIMNSDKMEVAALLIDQRGWFREQKIIPYSKVRSVGNDAITIDKANNAERPINIPEILKLIKEKSDPLGTRVIAENGTVLGLVEEYYIDEQTGKITSLEISGKFLESLFKGKASLSTEFVRTMGADVIVVGNDAESNLQKLDGGLQETLSSFKDGTANLWETTVHRTKEMSRNLKDKYEKKEKPADELQQVPEPDTVLDTTSEVVINDVSVVPAVIVSGPEADPDQVEIKSQENDVEASNFTKE